MLKSSIFCLVVLVVGIQAMNEERIAGGKPATPGQIPYQVMLRRLTSFAAYCSGVIISDRFVISVATCALGKNAIPTNVRIVVGAHHRSGDGTLLPVSKITKHPNFRRADMGNNICILQTTEKIVFNNLIQAAKLPGAIFPNKTGLALTASGWGQFRVSNFFASFLIFMWLREKCGNWSFFYSNRRAFQPIIQLIDQFTCNFCAQEAWNAETVSLNRVKSVVMSTKKPFARTTIKMKALALAITAAHWQQLTILWSESIRGGQVCAGAECQIFTLVYSRTLISSETTWESTSETTSQLFY